VKRLAVAVAALALAGCGGGTDSSPPKPPRLPRALAQSWARQADAVASALAAGDGCTAQQLAGELRTQVADAAGRAPRRLLAALTVAVDDLPNRITCTPPAPPKHEKPKPPKHEPHHEPKHDHGKKKH
jgi:hypothetical protein